MVKGLAKEQKVRLYLGGLKSVEQLTKGDVLMGDDGNPRTVNAVNSSMSKTYTITYSSYLDVKDDRSFVCGDDAVLILIPDGNRDANRIISAKTEDQYVVEFVEPITDAMKSISGVKLQWKVFTQADDALSYVDRSLPNFLYESKLSDFIKLDPKIQRMFKLVRPLLPIRFVDAVTAIQNETKTDVDILKNMDVRPTDIPWLCGLYLITGICIDEKSFRFHLKELNNNIAGEVKRIFRCLNSYYDIQFDETSENYTIRYQGASETNDFFKRFMIQFGMYDARTKRYVKDSLNPQIYLESFSRIRGPFLAGILDGSSGYGLSDINHGLECYIRGIASPAAREVVADLARSCSLSAVVDQSDSNTLILAGGMLFRVPCVSTIPKDFPGLVSLTSYPNPDGSSVLLGMPMPFSVKESGTRECYSLDIQEPNKRCLLSDYTVVHL